MPSCGARAQYGEALPELSLPVAFVLIHLPLSLCFALHAITYKRSLSILSTGVAFALWIVFIVWMYTHVVYWLAFGLYAARSQTLLAAGSRHPAQPPLDAPTAAASPPPIRLLSCCC